MRPTIDLVFFELPLYTALVALGALVGMSVAYLYLRARSRRLSRVDLFLDGALLAFGAGWIGARAYHVVMRWDYYQARPGDIAPLVGLFEGSAPGGLGIRGALLLGGLSLLLYSKARGLSFWHLADAGALGLAAGQAIGWVGALVQGANYGVVSDSRIAIERPDLYGLVAPRFPLQHVEILLCAVVLAGLVRLAAQNRPPGTLLFVYLVAVGLANAVLGFQRGDETAYWSGLRIDQYVDLLCAALGLAGWATQRWTENRIASLAAGKVGRLMDV